MRFFLGTTPAPVRSLHVVRGATRREPADGNLVTLLGMCHTYFTRVAARANELRLVWDPPTSDGDLPLRGHLSV